jgi:hypothetical protein
MMPTPLTLIAPLKSQAPESLAALEQLMADEGRDIFERSPSTQFAALVLLGDRDGRQRLFMSADFDGKLAAYLDELWGAAPDTMARIFSYCEGYTGRDGFLEFAKQRSYKSQAYFAAFQDETTVSIKQKADQRRRLEAAVGNNPNSVAELAAIVDDAQAPPPWTVRLGPALGALLHRIRMFFHEGFWRFAIRVARWYGQHLIDPGKSRSAGSDIGQRLDAELDVRYQRVQVGQVQNQMTNISWIKPRRLLILRFSLGFVNFMAKVAFPPGDLAGVKTVHFARWAIIDDGTGLMFEGNFDGTWENYMGDFADRIAWGLDAIWGNTDGYPPAGMNDIFAFKRYIRDLQYPPAMTYMAYPDLSVLNTVRDRAIDDAVRSRRLDQLVDAL